MNVFLWHVHGSWTTALVQGTHTYYFPVVPDRGPDGRGRAQTWDWPQNAVEVDEGTARGLDIDVVLLQRPVELETLAGRWLGRTVGVDVPAVYVEHNAPQGRVNEMHHPVRDRTGMTLVHVTHFNALFWEAGSTPTRVIEHGIVDPGYRYRGTLRRTAAVINEATRRGRVTGTDLLGTFAMCAPLDVFGMDASRLGGVENLRQDELYAALSERRVYLHPYRWTSLGLSLVEAMHLGMPIVALATTEAPDAIPRDAGACSNRLDVLTEALRHFHDDRAAAKRAGECAREHARSRYSLERFLSAWDGLLTEVAA
ncbi:MAG: glycosyltransferase [Candidatus Eremiobacteraeota bacterium]|nr:glycosyltransferase [Candidatus Eremiobacteraeota bacterium]MBV9646754.1 glycosyltransferase [Candidatus Eremiobacteraeota bacterium]